jgi:hypothetical protein
MAPPRFRHIRYILQTGQRMSPRMRALHRHATHARWMPSMLVNSASDSDDSKAFPAPRAQLGASSKIDWSLASTSQASQPAKRQHDSIQSPPAENYADICKMSKAKRHQIHRACPGCRAAKVRCIDARPCPRCIKLKIENSCRLDDVSMPRPKRRRSGDSFEPLLTPALNLPPLSVLPSLTMVGQHAAGGSRGGDAPITAPKLQGFAAAAAALPSAGPGARVSSVQSSLVRTSVGGAASQPTPPFARPPGATAQPFGQRSRPAMLGLHNDEIHLPANKKVSLLASEAAPPEPFKRLACHLVHLSQALLGHVSNMQHRQELMQQRLHLQQQQLSLLRKENNLMRRQEL